MPRRGSKLQSPEVVSAGLFVCSGDDSAKIRWKLYVRAKGTHAYLLWSCLKAVEDRSSKEVCRKLGFVGREHALLARRDGQGCEPERL